MTLNVDNSCYQLRISAFSAFLVSDVGNTTKGFVFENRNLRGSTTETSKVLVHLPTVTFFALFLNQLELQKFFESIVSQQKIVIS